MILIISQDEKEVSDLLNLIKALNLEVRVSLAEVDVINSSLVIIPDQESYAAGMAVLQEHNLVSAIKSRAQKNKKILGIGLGMHLLFEGQLVGEYVSGLSLLEGLSESLPEANNSQKSYPKVSQLLGLAPKFLDVQSNQEEGVYFNCPYWVDCDLELIKALGQGSIKFPAIVQEKTVSGIQFLPEKSGEIGRKLLKKIALD